MIFIDISITDTDLELNKKPGVAYRGATPAEIERGFAQPTRGISRDTEIFAVKVSGDHLNDTIDKAIRALQGMKNPDQTVSQNPFRDPIQDLKHRNPNTGEQQPTFGQPRPVKDIPQA